MMAQGEEALLGIHPENWATVRVFLALETQWRMAVGPMGGVARLGLDYAAVTPLLLDSLGVKKKRRAEMFGGLRTMELAALGAYDDE